LVPTNSDVLTSKNCVYSNVPESRILISSSQNPLMMDEKVISPEQIEQNLSNIKQRKEGKIN